MARPVRVLPTMTGPRADTYGRWCPYCGFAEVGDDPRLYTEFRRCPRCRA